MTKETELALQDFITKCVQRCGYRNDKAMYESYEPWLYELAKKFVETYEANELKTATQNS